MEDSKPWAHYGGRSLVHLCRHRAERESRDPAFLFLADGTEIRDTWSRDVLDRRARAIAARLQREDLADGTVLLLFPPGIAFMSAFLGCLYAGAVAVPAPPPDPVRLKRTLPRLRNILRDAGSKAILTQERFAGLLKDSGGELGGIEEVAILALEEIGDDLAPTWRAPHIDPDDLAYLQYSSGSTTAPKGIEITHGNIMHNAGLLQRACGYTRETVSCVWMPHFHDFGLVEGLIAPIVFGFPCYIMSPVSFIRRPMNWLSAISRYRVTHSHGPNFAFDLCLERFDPRKLTDVDLSCWKVACNAAEQVRVSTLTKFRETFAPFGFRADAFHPAYGMAETTLVITGVAPGQPVQVRHLETAALSEGSARFVAEPGPGVTSLVGCGGVSESGYRVQIVDAKHRIPLSELVLGEIWVRGDSVARGYWRAERATEAAFRARLADGTGPFLRTGDLGFIAEDQLYICGRLKELVVIRGQNYVPQDIEQVVEDVDPAIRTNGVAAFAFEEEDEEHLGVVCEIDRKSRKSVDVQALIRHIKSALWDHLELEPGALLLVNAGAIPRTSSGKIKRVSVRKRFQADDWSTLHQWRARSGSASPAKATQSRQDGGSEDRSPSRDLAADTELARRILSWLKLRLGDMLDVDPAQIKEDIPFSELGISSVKAVGLVAELEDWSGRAIPSTAVWRYPNAGSLAAFVAGQGSLPPNQSSSTADAGSLPGEGKTPIDAPHRKGREPSSKNGDDPIAIVGLACRFPGGAHDPEAYWDLLQSGRTTARTFPSDRLPPDFFFDQEAGNDQARNTRFGSFLETDIAAFDPAFFGISPREACLMDPQQRLLLEVCWEALEHAGIDPKSLKNTDGSVFLGQSGDDYAHLAHHFKQDADDHAPLGTARSIAAGRISYVFGLLGPSVQIDTSCSSSLVAVAQACTALRAGETGLALCGGVNLILDPRVSLGLNRMGALGSDGVCKVFDAAADGYGRGEGCAVAILKRLSDARADGDRVLACIRGWAVGHDGASNGLTAPNGLAQEALMTRTLAMSGLRSEQVQYVEAHGTGTVLGDPIEVQSLATCYGQGRDQPLLVGSAKASVGHLEAAAGLAGLFKLTLALQKGVIPGQASFKRLNPHLETSRTSIRVVERTMDWPAEPGTRFGAVSSFGINGTLAHLLVADSAANETDPVATDPVATDPVLTNPVDAKHPCELHLTAHSERALQAMAGSWLTTLRRTAPERVVDLCHAATRRTRFRWRLALTADSHADLVERLTAFCNGERRVGTSCGSVRAVSRLGFLFTGQGSQHARMAEDLYREAPRFRAAIDRCAEILAEGDAERFDLRSVLYGPRAEHLHQTGFAQCALFAVGYGLTEIWRERGIVPELLLGHSLGEYLAAHLAGIFSLEDALRLVRARGSLMQALPPGGAMVDVATEEDRVRPLIERESGRVAISALNAPGRLVISGEEASVERILSRLPGVVSHRLRVSHAFHSPLMEPMLADFERVLAGVTFSAAEIPIVSTVTGKLDDGAMSEPSYWLNQITSPVRFRDAIMAADEAGMTASVEIGPRPVLSRWVPACLGGDSRCVPSLQPPKSDRRQLLESLGALFVQGFPVRWESLYANRAYRHLDTPTYPFQRKHYWFDMGALTMNDTDLRPRIVGSSSHTTPNSRDQLAMKALTSMIADLLHMAPGEVDPDALFLELGADSIILFGARKKIEELFGVNVPIQDLFESFNTVRKLAVRLAEVAERMPASAGARVAPEPVPQPLASPHQPPAGYDVPPVPVPKAQPNALPAALGQAPAGYGQLVDRQLQTMERIFRDQLAYAGGGVVPGEPASVVQPQMSSPPVVERVEPAPVRPVPSAEPVADGGAVSESRPSKAGSPVLPPWSVRETRAADLAEEQTRHLADLTEEYTKRTRTSRKMSQDDRSVLADNRVSAGFRMTTKELQYPIFCDRAEGPTFVDLDGNRYLDITMGFGALLFGNHPDFVVQAMQDQLARGLSLGPHTRQAGEAARLVRELTGMERVAFCTTGTEAVMTVLRATRMLTGRRKTVVFQGSYHGHFDGVLTSGNALSGNLEAESGAPGVLPGSVADVISLPYDDPRSLEVIRAQAGDIACVLVEPVQSRRPDLQPGDFLRQLRELTRGEGIPLVFDEMITGFRIHPGGAQAHFGVRADAALYGKVIGGGMPIGVIAGSPAIMDCLDGGMWQFGDESYPAHETTFYAGTYNKHPLSVAAAVAVLSRLKNEGPELQERLNRRTERLVQTLNGFFESHRVPMRVDSFGSLFRFKPMRHMELFFFHLLREGVYVWEGRACFLSTEHTEVHIEQLVHAVQTAVESMRQGGFLPDALPVNLPARVESAAAGGAATDPWRAGRVALKKRVAETEPFVREPERAPAFSLFFFGHYEAGIGAGMYDLLFDCARFADDHDFRAIWVPERHFHAFGGLSPNPSVLAASLAGQTRRLQLCAGSVVLPLHHPVRVAEEWSMVDNLSKGRVGLACASGWNPNDFVLAPKQFEKNREVMYQNLAELTRLWRGNALALSSGEGKTVEVSLHPLPVRSELPLWLTIVSNPETYIRAGELGLRVLTNLMGQTPEELAVNIRLYRESLAANGFPEERAHVTLLLHTYVGDDLDRAREEARQPFFGYLESSLGLFRSILSKQGLPSDLDGLSDEDRRYLLQAAYERYVTQSALIGTPESCAPIVERLVRAGVDEFACLVDFGVDPDKVRSSLIPLDRLRSQCANWAQSHADSSRQMIRVLGATEVQAAPPSVEVETCFPLSLDQQQVWVLTQTHPEASFAYQDLTVLRLDGALDRKALAQAVKRITARHPSLRTALSEDGETQCVFAAHDFAFAPITLGEDDPDRALANWLAQESETPFDLARGPLWRLNLLVLAPERHVLALATHHLLIDGWSVALILEEIGACYSAITTGKGFQPSEAMSYEALLAKAREAVTDEHLAFWRDQLQPLPPQPEIPADFARPKVKSYRGKRLRVDLDVDQPLLRKVGAAAGCTRFMTLLAALDVLVFHLAGQTEFVIGVPSANREDPQSHHTVGYMANLLPVRRRLAADQPFVDHLRQTRSDLGVVFAHQDYPYGDMVKHLVQNRTTDRGPLVNVVFNVETAFSEPVFDGLDVTVLPSPVRFRPFDLSVNIVEFEGRLFAECDFNTDLFAEASIRRFTDYYRNLLQTVLTDPDRPIGRVSLFSEHEALEWRESVVSTLQTFEVAADIASRFERMAAARPEAVALRDGDRSLTYRELDQRANQMARLLRDEGVGPETPVALLLDRSLELVVAMLATLKAGGTYIPLDPRYPVERLEHMVSASGAVHLIGQPQSEENTPWFTGCRVSVADPRLDRHSAGPLERFLAVDQSAYMIFTSGSTGRPKGVVVTHRNVLRLFAATEALYGFDAEDVWTLFHSPAFDFSVWEIWGALLYGGCLVVVPYEVSRTPERFYRLLVDERVTVLNQTPSAFAQLIEVDERQDAVESTSLRWVIFGGEALQPGMLEPWFARHGDERPALVNMYGITETTVHVTEYRLTSADLMHGRSVIGRPIGDLGLLVLDANMEPVPVGVVGELYVAGAGLARGYRGQPGLSADRFLPNPFGPAGSRLYRSGDLARYRPDGSIEYLGRRDHQVKIRGFRIELGEIESVLIEHPRIRQAVVLAHRDNPNDHCRLVAFYRVEDDGDAIEVKSLREHVARRQPDYMVPAQFVAVSEFPLTLNGKLDRGCLVVPDQVIEGKSESPPETETERTLAAIWEQVLGVAPIGRDDRFFEVGGDSILALKMLAQARERDIELDFAQLFEYQRLDRLAEAADAVTEPRQACDADPFADLRVELNLDGVDGVVDVYPMAAMQEGMLFHAELESHHSLYHNVCLYRISVPFEERRFKAALVELFATHDVLRTHFSEPGVATPYQWVREEVEVPLQVFNWRGIDPDRREEVFETWFETEKFRHFDLQRAPLLRFHVLLDHQSGFVLGLTMHHAILDGWSLARMLTDLFLLYTDRRDRLPACPLRYRDFVALERSCVAAGDAASFWRERLGDTEPFALARLLPGNDAIEVEPFGTHEVYIPSEVGRALERLSRDRDVPLKSLALAAHCVALSVLTGSDRVMTGMIANGRPEEEGADRVLGLFVNTLPISCAVGGRTWIDLAENLWRDERDMMPHRRFPISEIFNMQGGELFDTYFNYLHFHVFHELTGVEIEELPGFQRTNFTLCTNFGRDAGDGHLRLVLEYDSGVVDPDRLQAFGDTCLRVMEAMAAEPDLGPDDVSLLSERTWARLQRWNRTEAVLAVHPVTVDFEAVAASFPDAVALVFGNRTLTYSGLNRRANRMAAALRERGVGPETLVGVCLPREPDLVVSLLAVLKAGGAYVPLDPDYPAARLNMMLDDAGVRLLLTHADLVADLEMGDADVLLLDRMHFDTYSESDPKPYPEPDHLAYTIYTSGSTGKPKGVQITHGALQNFLCAMRSEPGLHRDDSLLAVTTVCFDIAALELFLPLTVGARVVLVDRETAVDGRLLCEALERHEVTIMQATPATWRLLLDADWEPMIGFRVLCGGEGLPVDLARRLLALPIRLHHLYGPTETTIWSSTGRLMTDQLGERYAPVGQPIQNTRAYILDGHLNPVSIGAVGDLYLAGSGLARGYAGRPKRTAVAFLPEPFGQEAGSRMYATGDRARFLDDGSIEILGRGDSQVKIRGYRIELGDIEAALESHEQVKQCVVTAPAREDGFRDLHAFLIPADDADRAALNPEQVAQWERVWSETYGDGQAAEDADPTLNLVGWNSSYTGRPLPRRDMLEWVDATVARVADLRPGHILEVGCGLGLLLFRLAPRCQSYWATDLSQAAIDYVGRLARERGLNQVHLETAEACAFETEGKVFDLVLLNSVVQYFPSMSYLVDVLKRAAAAVRPGGVIMIGDVREKRLLEAFQASVLLERTEPGRSARELVEELDRRLMEEEELAIDHQFFKAVVEELPAIAAVELLPKPGTRHNEMNRFRYDVLLHVGNPKKAVSVDATLDWKREVKSLDGLRDLLSQRDAETLHITDVPNERVVSDVFAGRSMRQAGPGDSVADLRERLARCTLGGVDPSTLESSLSEVGRPYAIDWGADRFELLIAPAGALRPRFPMQSSEPKPWSHYGSYPLRAKLHRDLVPRLRAYLAQRLPEYMVPSGFVLLDRLPLTANGKVDRKALVHRAVEKRERQGHWVAPRGVVEEVLASVWQEILGLDRVGCHDSFFELGGHSLLATRLVARVRAAFSVEISVRDVFDRPTLAALARSVEQRRSTSPTVEETPRSSSDAPPRLHFAQRRMWLLEQLDGGSARYLMPAAVLLEGPLDVPALKSAFTLVMARHEPLRMTIATRDGAPVAILGESPDLTLEIEDIASDEVDRLVRNEAVRPFDLSREIPIRVRLARIEPQKHLLLVTLHHIAADAWSLGVLMSELSAAYRDLRQGKSPRLASLSHRYSDFAAWQAHQMQGPAWEQRLDFWRAHLADLPSVLDLPTDRPRPTVQTSHGALFTFELGAEMSRGLAGLAQRESVSLFMLMLSAFQVFLARLSGQDDVAVGTVDANRTRDHWEPLIGFFANTLVLRTRLAEVETFTDVLARVREDLLKVFQYRDMPFEKLVEELQPERNLAFSPLFQVGFTFQNTEHVELDLPGLTVHSVASTEVGAKYDLTLVMETPESGLLGTFEYNADLFEAETIARFVRGFKALLADILAQPRLSWRRLACMPSADRDQVLHAWQVEADEALRDRCFTDLFGDRVREHGSAPALMFEGGFWSYAELDRRSDLLAATFREKGVTSEDRVGVVADRVPLTLAAMLACFKLGAVYVPLDPGYPEPRLRFIVEDAHLTLWVGADSGTMPPLGDSLPRLIWSDDRWDVPVPGLSVRGPSPETGAYLIYTSGSTGRPKGVLVSHRGLPTLAHWQRRTLDVKPGDRVLQFASPSFDASIWETTMAFALGATLCLVGSEHLLPGPPLRQTCARWRITHLTLQPSALKAMPDADLPDLRTVVVAGEACTADVVAHAPKSARLFNAYGPTEDTVCSSAVSCESQEPVTIGTPIDGDRIYLLDEHMQPVPVGVRGELYLSGIGLARGYHRRPGHTARRFVPNPFSGIPGDRMYRTGDLGRYASDGRIVFLGRVDHQVKVRGFRVETAEVEAVLGRCPGVGEHLIVAQSDASGSSRLLAFVTGYEGRQPKEAELRRYLAEELPGYMVPSAIRICAAFPKTPNGKIDRDALLADFHRPAAEASPRRSETLNPLEIGLIAIWESLLDTAPIGTHDNFFAVGGHSLLAAKLMARIHEAFGIELPVKSLFEHPTIEELAVCVRQAATKSAEPTVAIPPRDARTPAPLTHNQERLWFLHRLGSGSAYDIPLALRIRGPLRIGLCREALARLVRRHETLRMRFPVFEDRACQEAMAPESVRLSVVDAFLDADREEEGQIQALLQEAFGEPIDLEGGPSFRAKLWILGDEDHLLCFSWSHLIADLRSVEVFFGEFSETYRRLSRDPDVTMQPSPRVQFADFAQWQRDRLAEQRRVPDLEYWLDRLADLPDGLALPYDRPPTAQVGFRGGIRRFELDGSLRAAVLRVAANRGASPFMVLVGLFAELLARYSGQTDILLGTPVNNRNRPELRDMIGYLVNTLVLRIDCSGDPSFHELLDRVAERVGEALAHAELPFGLLVEELASRRARGHEPLFQVMISYQDVSGADPIPAEHSDLQVTLIEPPVSTAKFHLTLVLTDHGDRIEAGMEYNADLFDAETVDALCDYLVTSTRLRLDAPQRRSSGLSSVHEPCRDSFCLIGPKPTDREDADVAIHQRIDAVARLHVGEPALVYRGESWSYQRLLERADDIALLLMARGFGCEDLVLLGLPRSPELLAAMLAVLKVGAAFVPVDLHAPARRLVGQTESVDLVLTSDDLVSRFEPNAPELLVLPETMAANPTVPQISLSVFPEQLAYVLFTSGSTGVPKGCQITHGNLDHYLDWALSRYVEPESCRRFSWFTPLTFDFTLTGVFCCLLRGGTLHIYDDDTHLGAALRDQLEAGNGVDLIKLTPTHVTLLSQEEVAASETRIAVLGGEALQAEQVRALRRLNPDMRLVNEYGPTEVTVGCLTHEVQSPDEAISIGTPIAGITAYVLDAHGLPVPRGAVGELCLAGAGLSRGYRGMAGRTATSFVPDPYADQPGSRYYRTGDLVRMTRAGELHYLGRQDEQVKINGLRIELGDVAHAMSAHEGVAAAVAGTVTAPSGEAALTVWWVPGDAERAPVSSDIRAFLQVRLPRGMVPRYLVMVPRLPHTRNGKVDRAALPEPDFASGGVGAVRVEPRNVTEHRLRELWQSVLPVAVPGIHDDFFELGGHSMAALMLVSRIERAFDQSLPLATFLAEPTIAGNAAALNVTDRRPVPVPLCRSGQERAWFVAPGANGDVLYLREFANAFGGLGSVYGLQSPGLQGERDPIDDMQSLARVHCDAIRYQQPQGPYYLAGHSFGGKLVFEVARLLEADGASVARLLMLDPAPPVDLSDRPEFRKSDRAWLEELLDLAEGFGSGAAQTEGRRRHRAESPPLESSDHELVLALGRALAEAGLVPQGADATFVRHLVAVYRTQQGMSYAPQGRLKAPLLVVRSTDDRAEVWSWPELEGIRDDPCAGWGDFVSRATGLEAPGNHLSMLRSANALRVAELVADWMSSDPSIVVRGGRTIASIKLLDRLPLTGGERMAQAGKNYK
ncbi:Amino acid adenylation domain-containing protein [Sulfidibacter corallicola]|uniref:Amino acid adenylation domain-containing protein n=1 Tax=Sulfidibacter corallicola TaxID=2818388 RepID=A0A8A4TCX8_SULCO|nr:non-ribosomal peptide synthetase/type I polyketide synthase [Sulfidibacter corallicola]QTD47533.1 amino acid adenylation domain-containing protein [Sulfidibacter corallicola]